MDFKELASLVALNSYTKNKPGVDENGRVFARWMESLGYHTTHYRRNQIGDHLHFTAPKQDGRKVLLLGHLDTVFPAGTFEQFKEDDSWVYGPGVCDMKGGNWIALNALRNLHQQYGGLHNIDMLLVSDEETGSDDSKHLTAELVKAYDTCLVFEAAGAGNEVVIARKGVATIYLDFTGKAAHAGNHYTDGCDANLAAAQMLIDLTSLTNLELGTTVNVGKMSGGIGANTVSPHAHLVIEFRFTCGSERDRVLAAIDQLLSKPSVEGVSVKMSGGLQRDVMESSPGQQQLLDEIEGLLGYALPVEKRGGVSDANVASSAGVPTLDGFGPFGDGDHTIHERASKASFEQRIREVTTILSGMVMSAQ
ncbi:peptidase M20 [Endozoicomonas montiporae]|uniref:Peptidase M20 n=2 Tax=Endozoicomonas montiporae TaxID=1027273 RepID=A0A081N2X7_9GAMM|nr:M20 family metallopeptidase [Endozoicomonas montiporae]AMO58066.1 carboxypeptidase G2 [Endozoicomonas montiporae CL-33]KEQ12800.1 peptidase M20 [Endozoicomonas montiporae]